MEKKKIELLAPAGDMERLKMAVAYGADAVYLAGTTFGMRSFAGNFTPDELRDALSKGIDSGKPTLINCVIDPAVGVESGHIGNLNPKTSVKI